MVGDVDEVDRDHAGGGALLGPMADPADVRAVAQGHRDRALRLGALDPLPHGLLRHGLAEAAPGIEHQHAAIVGDQLLASGWAPAGQRAASGHSPAACRRRGCRGRRGWPPPGGRRRPAPRPRRCPWRGRQEDEIEQLCAWEVGMCPWPGCGRRGRHRRSLLPEPPPREKVPWLNPAGRAPGGRPDRRRWRRQWRRAAAGRVPAARMPECTGSG